MKTTNYCTEPEDVGQKMLDYEWLVVAKASNLRNALVAATRSELDDLLQWGRLGLWRAIKTFDPEKGVKFATFAGHIIRWDILAGAKDYQTGGRRKNPSALDYTNQFTYTGEDSEMCDYSKPGHDVTIQDAIQLDVVSAVRASVELLKGIDLEVGRLMLEEISGAEIGRMLGISNSHSCFVIRRIVKKIKYFIERDTPSLGSCIGDRECSIPC